MKSSVVLAAVLIAFLCVPALISARRIRQLRSRHEHPHPTVAPKIKDGSIVGKPNLYKEIRRPLNLMKRRGQDTLQIAGSNLPDCSHACGSCTPCRLVLVSFVCSSLEEAETCPIAYKCMCKNNSYPVP